MMIVCVELWHDRCGIDGKIGKNVGISGELADIHINQKMHQK